MESNERRSSGDIRERNLATLRDYFGMLRRKNADAWGEIWAERCVVFSPYAPEGVPRVLTGRADVRAFSREQLAAQGELSLGEVTLLPLEDPNRVAARWFPRGRLAPGEEYANEHFAIFEFDADGRIAVATEYFDPAALAGLSHLQRTSTGAV